MFLSAKMSKLAITTTKDNYDAVLSALHDIGLMQIEQISPSAGLRQAESLYYRDMTELAQRFRSLSGMLKRQPNPKRYSFNTIEELIEASGRVSIDERVIWLNRQIGKTETIKANLEERLSTIGMLKGFAHDISILNSPRIVSFIVADYKRKGKDEKEFNDWIRKLESESLTTKIAGATIISMERSKESRIGEAATKTKLQMIPVPREYGVVNDASKRIRERIELAEQRLIELNQELDGISKENYPIVSAIKEQLELEAAKQDVTTKLGQTQSTISIEGWVPTKMVQRLKRTLSKITSEKVSLTEIDTKEIAPTKMENPRWSRLYEFFIRFYSLPKSNEIDPTMIFAVLFPVFFGFMVGDFGYGAVMLAFSIWLSHRIQHPPKRSRIPKKISSFVHTIISDNGLFFISRAIMPGAVIAMVLGAAFDNYFGFALPYYTALFNVQTGLSKLLLVSGWIGVGVISFGLVLGFVNNMRVRNRKHAYAKLGWLMTAWGIVLTGLLVLHRQSIGFSNPVSIIYIISILAGIAVFLAGEGVQSLMELPSIVSHILSYTRLVGILLASFILAEVIDLVFTSSIHSSLPIAIFGIVILVVGQLFNLVIAVFEPGIQGARLIYVEMFSKFFSGNGQEFKPFKNERRHTISRFSIEK
jgi:Archaeal/vacuolar-type H+-ATPase subunit I